MSAWWKALSLKNKLQIPIQLILLVILVFAQRWAFDQFEERVLEEARQKATVSADGVINGLNMMMINGIISNPDQRKLYVSKMGASERVEELRVIRNKPVQDQFGPGLPEEQPQDDMDRRALETGKPQFTLLGEKDNRSMRAVVPFIAQSSFRGTNCLQCHMVQEGTVNGAASITLNLSEEYAVMRQASIALWVGQLVMQVVLFFVIGSLINRVIHPAKEMQQTMQIMQSSGDLSQRAVVHSKDEIGHTGEAFNALVKSFQSIVGQVHGYAIRCRVRQLLWRLQLMILHAVLSAKAIRLPARRAASRK